MKNSILNTGIPSTEEKIYLLLNIPEYWNRLNSMISNEPFIWPDGLKTFPQDTFPFSSFDVSVKSQRIEELIQFSMKWRIKSQFIQPLFNGAVLTTVVTVLKHVF
jgi:hypothetical protein